MNDYHKSSLEYLSLEHNFCGWNLTFLFLWSEFKEAESIDSSWLPIIVVYVSIIIIACDCTRTIYVFSPTVFFSRQNIECLHAFWLGIKVKLIIRQDQANICIDVSRVAKKTCSGWPCEIFEVRSRNPTKRQTWLGAEALQTNSAIHYKNPFRFTVGRQ